MLGLGAAPHINEGREKMKYAIIAAMLMFMAVGSAFGQADAIDLGTLGGNYSVATAINESGLIVGSSLNASGQRRAVLWGFGGPIDLGSMSGGWSRANDINDAGLVVGTDDIENHGPNERGFLVSPQGGVWYQDLDFDGNNDLMVGLPTLGGVRSGGKGINNSGLAVGYADPSGGSEVAAQWDTTVPPLTAVQLTGGSIAGDVNDSGLVVGGRPNSPACVWDDPSTRRDLPVLAGGNSFAHGVNNNDVVVGFGPNAGGQRRAQLWMPDLAGDYLTATDLPSLSGDWSEAYNVNDAGYVVGESRVAGGDHHAFIWHSDLGMVDLNDLLPAGTIWDYLQVAKDINEHGDVVGDGFLLSGEQHAFVMETVPEPVTLGMLCLGGPALLRRRR